MNLSNTPFKIIKTKDRLNKTVNDFKTTNKD